MNDSNEIPGKLIKGERFSDLHEEYEAEIRAGAECNELIADSDGLTRLPNPQDQKENAELLYIDQGMTEQPELASHMKSIDFETDQPPDTKVYEPGEPLSRVENRPGSHYAEVDGDHARLGMKTSGKHEMVYASSEPVTVVRSVAADWTTGDGQTAYEGGSEQFFTRSRDLKPILCATDTPPPCNVVDSPHTHRDKPDPQGAVDSQAKSTATDTEELRSLDMQMLDDVYGLRPEDALKEVEYEATPKIDAPER